MRGLAAFLTGSLLLLVVPVMSAVPAAAELVADNTNAHFACNATIQDQNGDSNWWLSATEGVTIRYACQVQNATNQHFNVAGGTQDKMGAGLHRKVNGAAETSGSCMSGKSESHTTIDSETTTQIRFTQRLDANSTFGGTGATSYCNGTTAPSPWSTNVWEITTPVQHASWTACTSDASNDVFIDKTGGSIVKGCMLTTTRVNDATQPAMPVQFFSGGSSVDPTAGVASGVQCGGKPFQDKDGGWWVTLFARDTESPYPGSTRQKVWTGTWTSGVVAQPVDSDSDNTVTVALPALNSRPDWGWVATFHEFVRLPTGVTGKPIHDDTSTDSDGKWTQDSSGNWFWNTAKWLGAYGSVTGGAAWIGGATTGAAAAPATAAGAAFASFSLTSWALHNFVQPYWPGSPTAPATLGPAAKGFTPSGARFLDSGGTQVSNTATWQQYEVVCPVMVQPTQATDSGGTNFVQPNRPDGYGGTAAPSASDTGGGCSAGVLGDVPVVGGLFDGFARTICGLADVFGRLASLIRSLLIPDFGTVVSDVNSLVTTATSHWPFSWLAKGVDAVNAFVTGMSGHSEGVCDTFANFRPSATGGPSGSGDVATCDVAAVNTAAGWCREIFTVLIWIAVARRIWESAPWNKGVDSGMPG